MSCIPFHPHRIRFTIRFCNALKTIVQVGSILALFLTASGVRAQVSIPAVGQPSPFYGAAGRGVTIEATADPTELPLDGAITYTLRLRNLANAPDVRRPDLAALDSFRDFQVEDDPTPETEPSGSRVFRYVLRPRQASVTNIAAIVFPYYDPSIAQPPDRPDLPFRKARTDPIPIRIRKETPPPIPAVPLDVPDFAAVPAVATPTEIPRWIWWLATALPPVGAIGWCVSWQVRNPNGARLARRRRSRAAGAALGTLQSLGRRESAGPSAIVGAVGAYLAERFNLPGVYRSHGDLAVRLREAGADAATVAACAAFLRMADAARFAPRTDVTAEALIADAERLIASLEGQA